MQNILNIQNIIPKKKTQTEILKQKMLKKNIYIVVVDSYMVWQKTAENNNSIFITEMWKKGKEKTN